MPTVQASGKDRACSPAAFRICCGALVVIARLVISLFARSVRPILIGGAASVAFASPALAAITFAFGTGNPVGNSQKLYIDSNNCATDGPRAAYVGGRITNSGAATETNVVVSISGLNANIFLAGGQAASQSIGSLAPGESIGVYWFVGYSCTLGATAAPTISVASTAGTANSTLSLAVDSAISANAGGLIQSSTLGAGAILGQIITLDVEYSFGGAGIGDEYYFQPTGGQAFRADCFRLIGSEITASAVTAAPLGTLNDMHFVAAAKQTGTDKRATVRYYFRYLCDGTSTVANPYAAQTSGTQIKYSGNFGVVPITYPPATNPFTVTKTVSPTSGVPGSTGNLTYTVTIHNPSVYSTVLDSITDTLPAGMTFVALAAGSNVTAANSSSIPATGATGTLVFRGRLGTSYALAPGGSVVLVFTATRPATAGSYVNTAYGTLGLSNTVSGMATYLVANPISAANDSASGINGAAGASNVVNVLPNDSLNGSAPSTAQVTISVVTPASNPGVTLDTSTGNVSVAAGTPAGTYTIGYRVCETANSGNCANATATITVNPSVDLQIVKSNGVSTVTSGSTVTYSVVATNAGPDAVTGAVVTDSVGTGLTCPAGNAVTITGSGVPAGSFTIANLTGAGITLGTLSTGQSATLTYSCQVN